VVAVEVGADEAELAEVGLGTPVAMFSEQATIRTIPAMIHMRCTHRG
jgi:hypothetical protein